jgi:hypothetical protein
MKRASLRLIQAHDIERTLTTFECLYRGKPVTDPVTEFDSESECSSDDESGSDECHGNPVAEGR